MFKRFAIIAALTLASAMAFAVPKPSEVKAAVASGNYAKAEQMLKEVIQEKPSARAHYDLGQVYTFEGKHNSALNEYRQAQALDPSLKFASSAAEFTKKLATAQTMVAPPPVVVAQQAPPPTVAYAIPTVTTPTTPAPKAESGGSAALMFVILLFVFGGIAAVFYVATTKRQKKVEADLIADAKRRKNTTLLGFSKSLEDALLIAKTATYDGVQKRQIMDRIAILQGQTRSMIADLKDGKEVTAGRMNTLETNVNTVVEQSANGIPASAPKSVVDPSPVYTPAPKPAADPYPIPGVPTQANPAPVETTPPRPIAGVPTTPPAPVQRTYRPAPEPRVVHHHHHTPAPAPAPVVVNNNDGLLTGVLIGSMMNQPHHTERVVERVVERQVPRYERDDYEAPAPRYVAPAPTFDTSDDKDDYAAPAPAIDSSSDSDDDTY